MHVPEPGAKACTEVGLPIPPHQSASRARIPGLMENGPTGTKCHRALVPGTHTSTYTRFLSSTSQRMRHNSM